MVRLSPRGPTLLLVLFSTAISQAWGQYFDAFDHFNKPQKCKLYKCDKGYEPVPNKKMNFQSPGCDAMGAGMNLFGGEDDEDEDGKPYEECCHEWHACQQICGISKQSCDEAYETCAEEKCKVKKDKKETCIEQSKQSMMMSNLSGCKTFEVTQNKACTCVTKYGGRHNKQREEALFNFYKKNAPKEIKKVSGLAKKADSMTKMAKLLQKLIRKYPQSIELVEDPQSKMYRKMFGDSGFGGAAGFDAGDFAKGYGGGFGGDDFDEDEDLGAYGEDDEDDFDVHEGLGSDSEDEEEEVKPPPPKAKKPEKKKRKSPPPPPPVEEVEEEEEPFDEFDQYQEL